MANTWTPDERERLLKERFDLRTALVEVALAAVGLFSLVTSRSVDTSGYHRLATFMQEAGAALFVAMVLALVWDFAGKRAFADEILAKANMSRDLAEAGIILIAASFKDERIKWDELFRNACRLDIYVAYASTWRNTQVERIEKLLAEESGRIRVVLPNPDDAAIVDALALRFEMTADDVRTRINEAKEFFIHRSDRKGKVEIYLTTVVPLFSFYRFNNKVVFALYNHRRGRLPVPTFICDEGGFLFEYFSEEIEGVIANTACTKKVSATAAD